LNNSTLSAIIWLNTEVRYLNYKSVKDVLRKFYRLTAIFSRNFSYPGFTLNEAIVLGTVARNPGIIAHDISEYYAIDRGYLSKILKKLESAGLIVRKNQKRPPFEKLLSVTSNGRKIYNEIENIVDRSIDEHLSGLAKNELGEFLNTISALMKSLNMIVPDYHNGRSNV